MSSGAICYPLNRPIAAGYYHKPSGGKLFVIGSIRFFDDEFFEKENNQKIQEAIFSWLLSNECEIQNTVRDSAELTNKNFVPDVASMADRLRSCLQASEEVSRELNTLFDMQLFKFDTDYITESIALYEKLKVKHEPLTLIPPQFETPMPSL